MDIVTLALAKKFATQVSAGYSSVTVDEPTSTIIFTLNDGSHVSLKIPVPKNCGIQDIQVNTNKHLIFTMEDSTTIDAGEVPTTEGKSAYQVAVDNGYTGTEAEWLESLKGTKTADVCPSSSTPPINDGITMYIDTSNPNEPILKYKDSNNQWQPLTNGDQEADPSDIDDWF